MNIKDLIRGNTESPERLYILNYIRYNLLTKIYNKEECRSVEIGRKS